VRKPKRKPQALRKKRPPEPARLDLFDLIVARRRTQGPRTCGHCGAPWDLERFGDCVECSYLVSTTLAARACRTCGDRCGAMVLDCADCAAVPELVPDAIDVEGEDVT
jgi:hypothetical protein